MLIELLQSLFEKDKVEKELEDMRVRVSYKTTIFNRLRVKFNLSSEELVELEKEFTQNVEV